MSSNVKSRCATVADGRRLVVLVLAASVPLFCALVLFFALVSNARASEERLSMALGDFYLVDSSGEVRNQDAEHEARLKRFDEIMHDELSKSGKFSLSEMQCPEAGCTSKELQLDDMLDRAKGAGARFVTVGAVEKMSTLVLWTRFEVYDVPSRQMVFNRLLTFRGDNDEAWRRAALYAARELIKNAPVK
jgi:hypothetical protein